VASDFNSAISASVDRSAARRALTGSSKARSSKISSASASANCATTAP
jgi:hypothetical protein